jgi:hypothetical protein
MSEFEESNSEEHTVPFVGSGKTKKGTNKLKKEDVTVKTAHEILVESFMIREDKEGKIKPAKVTRADLKLLVSMESSETLSSEVMDEICWNAQKSDPQLDCLTEIVFGIMESDNSDSLQVLFDSCVRIASGVWINKHADSFDLFRDFFHDKQEVKCRLKYLDEMLIKEYEARTYSIRSRSEDSTKNLVSGEKLETYHSGNISVDRVNYLERKALEKQKNNIFVIGCFWLIEKKILSYQSLVDFLVGEINEGKSFQASLMDVAVYLSRQRVSPDSRLSWVLSRYRKDADVINKKNNELDKKIEQKDGIISDLKQKLKSQIYISESAKCEIENLKNEIISLNHNIEIQQLDEKARRTHLRDSEGQVRARAVNLLSEEVLDPLRLSIAALQREIPKSEVAAHHIDLVIERIERELKWFKE